MESNRQANEGNAPNVTLTYWYKNVLDDKSEELRRMYVLYSFEWQYGWIGLCSKKTE